MGMERGPGGFGLWLTGFAFGAAIGGLLGVLYAPRKGSEIRAALAENIPGRGVPDEVKARINRMIESGQASAADLARQTQRELESLSSQAVSKLGDAKLRAQIAEKQAELRYLQAKERMQRHM